MDTAHLLRTARRHVGLSQRDFASAVGVPAATLASWESGRRQPSLRTVDLALRRVDLQVSLVRSVDREPEPQLVAHLRRPLVARLRRLVDDEGWTELAALAAAAKVQLLDPVASALWVPGRVERARVSAHQPRRELPPVAAVEVEVSDEPLPPYVLPVFLGRGRRVWVAPPAELALARDEPLRAADALLHDERGRDDAGRRPPAHRDPDERDEGYRALQSGRSAQLRAGPSADGRAWRVDAPVSLAQLLREGGTLPW